MLYFIIYEMVFKKLQEAHSYGLWALGYELLVIVKVSKSWYL